MTKPTYTVNIQLTNHEANRLVDILVPDDDDPEYYADGLLADKIEFQAINQHSEGHRLSGTWPPPDES